MWCASVQSCFSACVVSSCISKTSDHQEADKISRITDYAYRKRRKALLDQEQQLSLKKSEIDRLERDLLAERQQILEERVSWERKKTSGMDLIKRVRELESQLCRVSVDHARELEEIEAHSFELQNMIFDLENRRKSVSTKEKGQYTDEIRWFTARLLRYNVAPGHVESLMTDMQNAFDIRFLGGLPSRPTAASFQDEQAALNDLNFAMSSDNIALTTDNGTRDYKTANVVVATTKSFPCYPLAINFIPNHSGKSSGSTSTLESLK